MVLGKLGRGPMILEMKIQMLRYWNKLLDSFSFKLNCKFYKCLYHVPSSRRTLFFILVAVLREALE